MKLGTLGRWHGGQAGKDGAGDIGGSAPADKREGRNQDLTEDHSKGEISLKAEQEDTRQTPFWRMTWKLAPLCWAAQPNGNQ